MYLKKNKILLPVLLILVSVSCKMEKKNEKTKPTSNLVVKKDTIYSEELKVDLSIIFEKRDHVQLYFVEDYFEKFSESKSFRKNLNANEDVQEVEFKFEKDQYPVKFRLDLGSNKEQEKVVVKQLKISRKNKQIVIDGKNIMKYFKANPYLNNIEGTGEFISEHLNNVYDPYLTSTDSLNYELEIF